MSICMLCLHVYICTVCLVHLEARRGHRIIWDWSYRQLSATMWFLGTKPRSSERAARTLSHRAISLVQVFNFKFIYFFIKNFYYSLCLF